MGIPRVTSSAQWYNYEFAMHTIQTRHVAAWVEQLKGRYSAPTVKQRLAAIRMLFDWLVVGQVVPVNPAAVVRGPRHSVSKGKTPVLTPDEARQLLDSLPTEAIAGLRDRALIGSCSTALPASARHWP